MIAPEYIDVDYIPSATLDVIDKTATALQQMHDTFRQTANKIDQTIAAMDFNDAEYKNGFVPALKEGFHKMLDAASENGFDGYHLDELTKYASDMFSDPIVTGKLANQQAYKANMAEILGREDLTDEQKALTLAANPYYGDKDEDLLKDDNGKVLKVDTWKPRFTPDEIIDYTELVKLAKTLVNADTDAWARAGGNHGTEYNVTSSDRGTHKYITFNKVWNTFLGLLNTKDGGKGMASVNQEYNFLFMAYKKTKATLDSYNEQATAKGLPTVELKDVFNHYTDLFDKDGHLMDKNHYMLNKFAQALSGIPYDEYSKYATYGISNVSDGSGNGNKLFNITDPNNQPTKTRTDATIKIDLTNGTLPTDQNDPTLDFNNFPNQYTQGNGDEQ